jgi:hypothetical protein
MEWVKTIKEIAAIGGWIMVSLFFMGQAAGYITSTDSRAYALLQQHDISLANHRLKQEELIEKWTIALRVLCENSAHGQSERNNCLNIR